ncbi:M56 family metallopeptidase [Algoriphagus taiwanensis]|uniref:Peptidase M56 domain-containing protein n=1 Tax=Algoriphagus taiwanensis TaxID=1445656 RepID=A0ABQ6Q0F0_9BACT|nr:hypothetical protein Ataiwa_19450 [Algoriphagus taiwanensis]
MEYLFKSILCLLLLLLFYRLFLHQEVLYRFNRFFLLAAVIGSFLIPLITYEVVKEVPMDEVSGVIYPEESYSGEFQEASLPTDVEPVISSPKAEFPWKWILWGVYLVGVAVFLIRFVRNIKFIRDQIKNNVLVTYRKETLVLLDAETLPFSFLKYIFFHKKTYETAGIPEAVFLHEQCHVREKHSWDILWLEFLLIPFWFHPGLHLALQAIRLNHEFIADREVIKETPVQEYQHLLVSILSGQNEFSLGSRLNFSLTKKRFKMMKKTSKPGIQILKIGALVAFLGVIVAVFAKKVEVNVAAEDLQAGNELANPQQPKILSLKVSSSGDVFLENEKLTREELSNHLASLKGEELVVSLNAEPGMEMGDVSDLQELLLAHNVRRIYFQKASNQTEIAEEDPDKERYYRDAIFLIESQDMEYTQKSYSQLSEAQKAGLLFKNKPVQKKTPEPEAYEFWKNKDEVALWIDGKPVDNSVLATFKPEDFVWAFQSRVFPNARSEKYPQPYQVHLYREAYYEQELGPSSAMFQPRTNQDTITLTQRNITSYKDLSRYPDPTTAYLQKNAKYEKLKGSEDAYSPMVKAELEDLYQELKSTYDQAPANRQKRLVKPLPPNIPARRKDSSNEEITKVSTDPNLVSYSLAFSPQSQSKALKSYIQLYGEYQTKAYENRLFSKWTQEEIHQLESQFEELRTLYSSLTLKERPQVQRVNFPFFRLEKDGKTIYKKIEELTEEERKSMNC